jgi:transcriptional regulator of met regulon
VAKVKPKLTEEERQARWVQMLRAAARVSERVCKKFRELGYDGEAVSPEEVREMMRKAGIDPEACEFTRAIVEERER